MKRKSCNHVILYDNNQLMKILESYDALYFRSLDMGRCQLNENHGYHYVNRMQHCLDMRCAGAGHHMVRDGFTALFVKVRMSTVL